MTDRQRLEELRRRKAAQSAEISPRERLEELRARKAAQAPAISKNSASAAGLVSAGAEALEGESLGSLAKFAGRSAADLALGAPKAAGRLLADASALGQTAVETLGDDDRPFLDRFRENQAVERNSFPATLGTRIPEEVDNFGVRALPRTLFPEEGDDLPFFERFARNRQELIEIDAEEREEAALSSFLADSGVNVAALTTLRSPLAKRQAGRRAAQRQALRDDATAQLLKIDKTIRDQLDDVITAKLVPNLKEFGQAIKRGTGKAGETALEAAFLAALEDGDPLSNALIGAAGQSAASAGLFLSEAPVKRLLPTIGLAYVASEIFKTVGPQDQDFFESKDFAIQKATLALGLGVVGAAAGGGRIRGPAADRLPVVFDTITTVPRGALLTKLQEMNVSFSEGNQSPFLVMEQFARDPQSFNKTQQTMLMNALQSEDPGEFTNTVNKLMQTENFRKRLQAQSDEGS